MDALRQLAESAGSAQQEAEALRAKETLAVADAAWAGRSWPLWTPPDPGPGPSGRHRRRQRRRPGKAGPLPPGGRRKQRLPDCRPGGGAGRRQRHPGPQPEDGGPAPPGPGGRPAGRTAAPAAGRHGGPHPSADGDGEGLRGLLPGGEGRDAGGGPGHPVRDPRPRGKPFGPPTPNTPWPWRSPLGAALQNIVVDRDTDAKEAIAFLKRRDAGRATFLPMSAIRGDMLREPRLAQEYGFVGIASPAGDV